MRGRPRIYSDEERERRKKESQRRHRARNYKKVGQGRTKQKSDERLGIVGCSGDVSNVIYSCVVGGKEYIGSTSMRLRERIWYHHSRAKNGSTNPFHQALKNANLKAVWRFLEVFRGEKRARLAREGEFILARKSLIPRGLNKKFHPLKP